MVGVKQVTLGGVCGGSQPNLLGTLSLTMALNNDLTMGYGGGKLERWLGLFGVKDCDRQG